MKVSVTISCLGSCFATVGPALAFVGAPSGVAKSLGLQTSLHMSDPDDGKQAGIDKPKVTLTPKQAKAIFGASSPERRAPQMSQALPFMKCPATLDGAMAADFGFDPLGFADSYETLNRLREAEIKHGRLAMLAAAGWPLSELWDAKIAQFVGMEPALNPDGRVPSVLNGGMGRVSVAYWIGIVWIAAALDVYGSYFAPKRDGYAPGDFGLRWFYPDNPKGQERMRVAEIKHGRVAMAAVVAFAALEFVSHAPVVDQFSLFFRPVNEVLSSVLSSQADYGATPEALTEAASTITSEVASPSVTEAAVSTVVEGTGSAPIPTIESISAASTEAFTTSNTPSTPSIEELEATKNHIAQLETQIATKEELIQAKKQIVDLEAKLAQIETLVR